MFKDCTSLETVKLGSFNLSSAENVSSMFENCTSLKTVNLQTFGPNRADARNLFKNCTSLENIVLPNYAPTHGTSNSARVTGMFSGCTNLKNIEMPKFNASDIRASYIEDMFVGCESLDKVQLLSANSIRTLHKQLLKVAPIWVSSTDSTTKLYNESLFNKLNSDTIYRSDIEPFNIKLTDTGSGGTISGRFTAIPGIGLYNVSAMRYDSNDEKFIVAAEEMITGSSFSFSSADLGQSVGGADRWKIKVDAVYIYNNPYYERDEVKVIYGETTDEFSTGRPQLAAPKPKFGPDGVLHWYKVPNATGYVVRLYMNLNGFNGLYGYQEHWTEYNAINLPTYHYTEATVNAYTTSLDLTTVLDIEEWNLEHKHFCTIYAIDKTGNYISSDVAKSNEEDYFEGQYMNVWVGETPVMSTNRLDVLGDGGSVQFYPDGSEYNSAFKGKYLVLDNAKINKAYYYGSRTTTDGHRAVLYIDDDVNIYLKGDSFIDNSQGRYINYDGIFVTPGNYVNFYGDGKLSVTVYPYGSRAFAAPGCTVALHNTTTLELSGFKGYYSNFDGDTGWLDLHDESEVYAYGFRDDDDREGLAIQCPEISVNDMAYLYAEYNYDYPAVETWGSSFTYSSSNKVKVNGIKILNNGTIGQDFVSLPSINAGSGTPHESEYRALEVFADNNIIAKGKGWYIEQNGTLNITGNITNSSTYSNGVITDRTPWKNYKDQIKSVYAIPGSGVNSTVFLFGNCTDLKYVSIVDLNTGKSSDMSAMFYNCPSIISLNLENIDVDSDANVTDFIAGCRGISSIKLTPSMAKLLAPQVMNIYSLWKNDSGKNYGTAESIASIWSTTAFSRDNTALASGTGWYLDGAGVLHIIGAITNRCSETDPDKTPWNAYKSRIKSIVTEKGASVENAIYLFSGLTNLETANLKYLDTSSATSMLGLFDGCSELWSIDLSYLDTSKVTDMSEMFYNCGKLHSVTMCATPQVRDMSYMFYKCSTLSNLYLYKMDTSNVTNMSYMFQNVPAKKIDVSGFNTSNVTNMSGMFNHCTGILELDISGFDVSRVTNSASMLSNCTALTTVKANSGILNKVAGQLKNISTSWLNTETGEYYRTTDELKAIEGVVTITKTAGNNWYVEDGCLHITGHIINNSSYEYDAVTCQSYIHPGAPWYGLAKGITSVVTEPGAYTANATALFYGLKNLVSADLSNLDISDSNSTVDMFSNCEKMKTVNLSGLDTSFVNNMLYMFHGCVELESLDVSGFNTSRVTSFQNMFNACRKLKSLDVSHFDTSNATDMISMFNQCNKLESLDVSHFNTANVTNMSYMFSSCNKLESIDVSHFNTSKVTDARCMFRFCTVLRTLDLSNFDTSAMKYSQDMICYCNVLSSVNLSNFVKSSDCTYKGKEGLLGSCSEITKVDATPDLLAMCSQSLMKISGVWYNAGTGEEYTTTEALEAITGKVTLVTEYNPGWYIDGKGCLVLNGKITNQSTSADNTPWKSEKDNIKSVYANPGASIDNAAYLFAGCEALTSININNLDMKAVTNTTDMLAGCTALAEMAVSPAIADKVAAPMLSAYAKWYDALSGAEYSTAAAVEKIADVILLTTTKNTETLLGDLNGDGSTDSDDAIYLLRATLDPESYPVNQSCDFNGDGQTDSDDAIYLLRHTLDAEGYPLA